MSEGRGNFFVTGAAGFLGAHLVRGLLSRGHVVTALVRHGRDESADERFRRVLGWLGVGREDAARVSVVAGDVAVERFGLPETTWRDVAGSVDEIVHCAASTAFTAGRRAELERVNVAGTGVALMLATAGKVSAFHHVSTAYAAGCAAGVVDETWREPAAFTNAYEETKHRAEALARAVCAASGIPLSVYRPAIVYGDSRTGRSLRFNALYYPVKMLLFLRDIHLADARCGGARSRDLGIASLPGGGVRLPIRIETHPDGGLDLVPVDHFERAFLAIRDGAAGGGTFHIVSGKTTRIETVIDLIRRRYRIEGFEAATPASFALRPRTPLEVLFEGFTAVYRPYMLDRRRFDDAVAGPLLARRAFAARASPSRSSTARCTTQRRSPGGNPFSATRRNRKENLSAAGQPRVAASGAGTFALLARRRTGGIVSATGVAETHHATRFGGG